MPEARSRSMLDFAIAASLAVVPVLLAVLLALATLAPSQREPVAKGSHVSVRRIAALKTFERAIVRRDAVQARVPSAEVLAAYVPECSAEWSGRDRLLDRIREAFGRAPDPARTPARRMAAHLRELDDALARMSSGGNRRVVDAVGFDIVRWVEAARLALATSVRTPQYPERAFGVRCSDLASAVAALSGGGGRLLAALAWRGTEVDRAIADWPPEQYVAISARQLARGNPWGGIPGCVYLWDGGEPAFFVKASRAANERVCTLPAVFAADERARRAPAVIAGESAPDLAPDDARWQVPPGLHALLQPLGSLQRTTGSLYRTYTELAELREGNGPGGRRPANRVVLDGTEIDVGFTVDLTIDPALQALAQKTAACYTGRQDVCRALGIRRAEDGTRPVGHRLLERAVVRMAAIAIIDVPSGRIEALAGALTPCTRQEYDGPGRAASCDQRLPYPVRYRPDALGNPAVLHDAMPASVVKPVMAAAFLGNASVGARWLGAERAAMQTPSVPVSESLRGQLMRSNSARFLDRMFCGDQGFRPCERPWEIQAVAGAFGWNGGCAGPAESCGKRDLLFGRDAAAIDEPGRVEPPAAWIPYGRLLVEPAGRHALFRARAPLALDTMKVKRCAAGADGRRASGDDWEKCRGGTVVDIVAEGWGQGHARSTALGAAGMMAALAAAANGQGEVRKPHLVRAVRGVAGPARPAVEADVVRWAAEATQRSGLARGAAEVILSGLSYSHRNGTARLACEQVFDARTCRDIDWIAGKTGTPTFPNDERSLDELVTLCAPGAQRSKLEENACGALRPYKWYVAVYRADRIGPEWTKAIGVLTERNWLADSGRIHGAGDHGPNPAAEIAFQIAGRHARTPMEDLRWALR